MRWAACLLIGGLLYAEPTDFFSGEWHVDRRKEIQGALLDEKPYPNLIGTQIRVTAKGATIGRKACSPHRADSELELKEVLEGNRLIGLDLGLPDPVHEADLGCIALWLRDAKTVVFAADGYLYEAHRMIKKR